MQISKPPYNWSDIKKRLEAIKVDLEEVQEDATMLEANEDFSDELICIINHLHEVIGVI